MDEQFTGPTLTLGGGYSRPGRQETYFSRWLRRKREQAGLTQAQLATALGYTEEAVGAWEAAQRRPRPVTISDIAGWAGIPEADLDAFRRFSQGLMAPWEMLGYMWTADVLPPQQIGVPALLSPLIGRGQDIVALCRTLLHDGVRWLTLTGPAGVGKTTLSKAAATSIAHNFSDGAYFVELASVADSSSVFSVIARRLGVSEASDRDAQQAVRGQLRSREMLLVLDNAEHLVDFRTDLEELLEVAPRLKLLITSRSPVGRLPIEYEYPVRPLAVPEERIWRTPAELERVPAVALFVERSRAAEPFFRVHDENAMLVAELCTLMDGLPLGIELVAAQIRNAPLQHVLTELRNWLGTPSVRTATPEWQAKLSAAFKSSYERLSPTERNAFAGLAIFPGSFGVNAARAVALTNEPLGSGQAALESFVARGLLMRQATPETGVSRYSFLQVVRTFGLECLSSELEAQARNRHARFFQLLATAAHIDLGTASITRDLDQLQIDQHNLHAALQWLLDQGRADASLDIAAALWPLWHGQGRLREARQLLDDALALGGSAAARARVLVGAGVLAITQSDYDRALDLLQEALALSRGEASGSDALTAWIYSRLGWVYHDTARYAEARQHLEQSLGISVALGDELSEAWARNNLGMVAMEEALSGETLDTELFTDAALNFDLSQRVFLRLGDARGLGQTHNNQGFWALCAKHFVEAAEQFVHALRWTSQLGRGRDYMNTLSNQGLAALCQNDYRHASELLAEALIGFNELGDRNGVAEALEALAGVIGLQERTSRSSLFGGVLTAARLYGAVDEVRRKLRAPLWPVYGWLYGPIREAVRSQIGNAQWSTAYRAGQRLALDAAIHEALNFLR
jgi:predicted ATPase